MKGKILFKNKEFQLRKVGNFLYLIPKGLNLSHCFVCGKRRKILRHHIIPKRCMCKINIINEFMLNVCDECEKKVHPEYRGLWKEIKEKDKLGDKIKEQRKHITVLLSKFKKAGLERKELRRRKHERKPNKILDN